MLTRWPKNDTLAQVLVFSSKRAILQPLLLLFTTHRNNICIVMGLPNTGNIG